jgi:hypothetical protein
MRAYARTAGGPFVADDTVVAAEPLHVRSAQLQTNSYIWQCSAASVMGLLGRLCPRRLSFASLSHVPHRLEGHECLPIEPVGEFDCFSCSVSSTNAVTTSLARPLQKRWDPFCRHEMAMSPQRASVTNSRNPLTVMVLQLGPTWQNRARLHRSVVCEHWRPPGKFAI